MTKPDTGEARLRMQIGEATAALLRLDDTAPGTAGQLVALVRVVADEAARTPRFAKSLSTVLSQGALSPGAGPASGPGGAWNVRYALGAADPENTAPAHDTAPEGSVAPAQKAPARRGKRAPGPFDPFAVYREAGEPGLRVQLDVLDAERLKDIIAEHAMDYDKLAMRWRTPSKLRDRIVERVKALTTKGDAFR
ncbi:hypothetical protein [Rhodococcus sp. 105337]|uniref:hypothetical protein n=1 Tax=Rhodococcus sp. 105337 TaxID=2725310 RepID=UPI003211E2CF